MPPLAFASGTSSVGASTPTLHIPKATQNRLKDVISRIRSSLTSEKNLKKGSGDVEAANKAIRLFLDDPNVVPPSPSTTEATQLASQLSQRLNAELVDIFLKDLDQEDQSRLATLVAFLAQLGEFLGSAAIIMEWWDLLLRPILKDPTARDRTASFARRLVIMAASAVPASAYKDEGEPTPSWPTANQTPQPRRSGDAPYPQTSTEPLSSNGHSGRSQSGSDIKARAPNDSTSRKTSGSPADMHRRFAQRLFDMYVQEASSPLSILDNDDEKLNALDQMQSSSASIGGSKAKSVTAYDGSTKKAFLWHALEPELSQPVDIAGTAWKGNLEAVLITFGQHRPKEFFHHLSASYGEPLHRIPILLLLTIFIRLNSIHTFHITSTRLMHDITCSLQLDTSTTLISLCITALIILIPQIPNWVANGGAGGVPVLLCIFSRIVDWRKLGPGWEKRLGEGEDMEALRRQLDEEFSEMDRLSRRLVIRPDIKWQRLESSVDTDQTARPDALRFFTIVYGIFPCNMIRFLRAPIDYLRKANCPALLDAEWEDLIDEPSLQLRCEPILRRHTLHPAIVELTAEREITDKQRWLHHDAADTTAECLSMSLESWSDGIASGPASNELVPQVSSSHSSMSPTPPSAVSRSSSPSRLSRRDTSRHKLDGDEILVSYAEMRWGGPLRRSPMDSQQQQQQQYRERIGSSSRHINRAVSFGPSTTRSTSSDMHPRSTGANQQRTSASQAEDALQHLRRNQASAPPSPSRASSSPHAVRPRPLSGLSQALGGLPAALRPLSISTSTTPPPETDNTGEQSLASIPALSSKDEEQQRAAKLEVYSELNYLQRENLLLRNELNYELYLKDQHLRHIGHLHRDRISDTRLEAERQNLYQTIKLLRSQLVSITATQERQRTESSTVKARHAQWENELNAKIKSFREERKTWTAESRDLQAKIETGRATTETQARRLDEANAELFELRTELQQLAPKAAKVAEFEARNAQLTRCLAYWDEDVKKYEEQRREMEVLLSGWREMEMLMNASEEDRWNISLVAERQEAEVKRLTRELDAIRRHRDVASDSNGDVARRTMQSSGSNMKQSRDSSPVPPLSRSTVFAEKTALQRRVEELEAEVLSLRSKAEASDAAGGSGRADQPQADAVEAIDKPAKANAQMSEMSAAVKASRDGLEAMVQDQEKGGRKENDEDEPITAETKGEEKDEAESTER
ncbi:unnamed protein product [Jaminaea pallidilutea]